MKLSTLLVIAVISAILWAGIGKYTSGAVKAIRYSSSDQRTNDAYTQFRTATGNR